MQSQFQRFVAEHYAAISVDIHLPPHRLGRRAVMLKAAEEFWKLDPSLRSRDYTFHTSGPSQSADAPLITDPDPLDFDHVGGESGRPTGASGNNNHNSTATPFIAQRGIIVRTDFSSNASWSSFLNSVLTSEREGMRDLVMESRDRQQQTSSTSPPSSEGEDGSSEDEDEDDRGGDVDVDEEQTASPSSTFVIIDPSSSPSPPPHIVALAPLLHNASNLTLLRLFADIDIIPCLPVPPGQQRRKQNHLKVSSARLIDSHGLHEIYNGRLIWVYDTKSNTDGCARLISGRPTSYGTATGDSWRARAPFIWELHVNIAAKTMQVDFGGEDRYDGMERMRNFDTVDAYSL